MLILLISKAIRDRVLGARARATSTAASDHAGTAPTRSASRARWEADEVRTMAAAHMCHDPSFANELYAAADRHEQLALG